MRGKRHGSAVSSQRGRNVLPLQSLCRYYRFIRHIVRTKTDYVSAVDVETIQPVDIIDKPVLVAMAVYIGKTRLIDNFTYSPPQNP